MLLPEATPSTIAVFNVSTLAISSFLAFIGIDAALFFWFAMLLIMDYVTGLFKAYAINESITSNKMKYGIVSKLSIVIIPVALAIGAKALGADFDSILKVGMTMLILSEIYSIISNVYAIRYNIELPEYDVLAIIGKRIRHMLLNYSEDKPDANS